MTTVAELVATIEARGITLWEKAGAIAARPARAVTPAEREALTAMREQVLSHLRARALGVDWSTVSLYQLDTTLEIRIPGCDTNVLLAPGCRIARALRESDPHPGRVWCTCEVLDLILTGVSPKDVRKIAETKMLFAGAVNGAKRRE